MSRTINSASYAGSQDVTIYPYQNVASIDADQILLDLVKPGVFNADVETAVNGSNIEVTIKAGTTAVFRKNFTTTEEPIYTRDFIVKVVLTDDIVITQAKTSFDGVTDDSIVLVIGWDWEEAFTTGTKKFADFRLVGGTAAELWTSYLQYGDLIICELLNHAAVKDTGGDGTYAYPIAYQNLYARQTDPTKVIKDYRDTFEHLNNGANQFNVQFGKKVTTYAGPYYATPVYSVSGYGIIRDTIFTIDETTDDIPVPLTTTPAEQLAAGTYQVDILRIVITDDASNTPELEWTSVSSETSPGTINKDTPLTLANALAVLGTQEIPFVDDGIILGIAVRTRASIGDGATALTANILWPYQFVRWNPTIPYVGHAPTLTRTSLPIYAEGDIDWS